MMSVNSESLLLTLLDFITITASLMCFVVVPAMLFSRQFRLAGKTIVGIAGAIAADAAIHTIASLLHS